MSHHSVLVSFPHRSSAHVSSHLGSSPSVYSLSLRDAGTGATRSCTFDDHTPPSCLIAYPLAKMGYRSVNTLVLPDPWLTQGGPVTFPACALYQLFVRSCDLAHHGLHCSHVCVCTHHRSLQHLPIWTNFRTCGCHLAPLSGITFTTQAIRSQHYILSNSYKLVRASPSSVQMSASTRESHGAATSSSLSCPQVTLSATHPQVLMDPTRTITNDLLSATLVDYGFCYPVNRPCLDCRLLTFRLEGP